MSLTPEEQKVAEETKSHMKATLRLHWEWERYLGALQAILASPPNEAHAIARIALDEGDLKPYF